MRQKPPHEDLTEAQRQYLEALHHRLQTLPATARQDIGLSVCPFCAWPEACEACPWRKPCRKFGDHRFEAIQLLEKLLVGNPK